MPNLLCEYSERFPRPFSILLEDLSPLAKWQARMMVLERPSQEIIDVLRNRLQENEPPAKNVFLFNLEKIKIALESNERRALCEFFHDGRGPIESRIQEIGPYTEEIEFFPWGKGMPPEINGLLPHHKRILRHLRQLADKQFLLRVENPEFSSNEFVVKWSLNC